MPRGTRHVLTGTLRLTASGYVLEIDDGGQWRLDIARSLRCYIGQAVTVEGTRSGFDLLDVYRIGPGTSLPPRRPNLVAVLRSRLRTVQKRADRP